MPRRLEQAATRSDGSISLSEARDSEHYPQYFAILIYGPRYYRAILDIICERLDFCECKRSTMPTGESCFSFSSTRGSPTGLSLPSSACILRPACESGAIYTTTTGRASVRERWGQVR